MHINETDLNKIMDALMSRDPTQCLVAQSIVVKAKDARADPALRAAAENRVMFEFRATDELEIDDDAGTSSTDEGTWVQAWVYVPAPEEAEEGEHERCHNCDEERDPEGASTHQQWQCACCAAWNDKPAEVAA